MLVDCLILLGLILLNGFFAMAELAIVSARRARLEVLARDGSYGAGLALRLSENPSHFLSSIQIGITTIGIFAGVYSGATIAEPLALYFEAYTSLGAQSHEVAITLVVVLVTYCTLVIGELVPKQLALRYAETLSIWVSRPMRIVAIITRPLVWILDMSNRLALKCIGAEDQPESTVSEEEVKALLVEGEKSGAIDPDEKRILERVMKLDDITIGSVMTPRRDVVWLDINESAEITFNKIRESRHSRYMVCEDDIENLKGVVVVKDLLAGFAETGTLSLRAHLQQPYHLPDNISLLNALTSFRQQLSNMAVVVDEYGSIDGVMTLKDIMEAIVGTMPEPEDRNDATATQRIDGSWLVDGIMALHEAEEILSIEDLNPNDEDYQTIAGFMMHHLGRIPAAADAFEWRNWRFEVLDMDGNRVDKVLVATMYSEDVEWD